ncbi:MAG: GrpB family protein [bacterium]|nr:GrpB family protein [bacterium]
MKARLREQLLGLGIDASNIDDPAAAWLALFDSIGRRATLIDRYEIDAASRGIVVADLDDDDRLRIRHEVLPILFPGWEERGTSQQIDPIVVVPYNPDWPDLFSDWRSRLLEALWPLDVRIEHVGSTAVPGLAAKSVIDISVGVPDVEAEETYRGAIESCGVPLRSVDEGHRYFRPAWPDPRVVQIHVVDLGSEWQRHHVLLRDYLRAHPDGAAAYEALKTEVAHAYRDDRLAYNAAKTDFILDHLEIAEEWARAKSEVRSQKRSSNLTSDF